jgi:Type IV secretion system pilin
VPVQLALPNTEGGRKADGRRLPPTNFGLLDVDCSGMKNHNHARHVGHLVAASVTAGLLIVALAIPVVAASDLNTVIDSVRNWVAGLLIALSTLFLTVAGVRYITAQGDPRAVEEAKAGIKAALIGYGLAALAPELVSILQKVLRT